MTDKAGRLVQVKEGSATTTYEYYNNGSLKKQTLPNNATANYTYYDNNRLHTLQNKNGSTTLEAYSYTYDGAGNLTAKVDRKGTTTYTYTDLSQLWTVTEPTGRVTTTTYDGVGNRETETVTQNSQSTVTTYFVDSLNRLTRTEAVDSHRTETTQFVYDDAGNMTSQHSEILSDEQQSLVPTLGLIFNEAEETGPTFAVYDYNARNQLIRANSNGTVVESTFGEHGYRSGKTSEGVTTAFLYEGDRVLMEADSDGGSVYSSHGLALISREVDSVKNYYLYNGHGDVTALLSPTGAIVAQYYYDAFGVITEQTGSVSNPYRYSGHYYDWETKLYDLKARFYDAKLARFLQEDTYYGKMQDPLSLNLYTYCRNNPLVNWDPTGHADVKVRSSNESQGNNVEFHKSTDPSQPTMITVTTKDGVTNKLYEGKDYYIGSDGTAYYKNNPDNKVSNTVKDAGKNWSAGSSAESSTIKVNESVTLKEGQDYYIGNDGSAYFYNAIRPKAEAGGSMVDFVGSSSSGNSGIIIYNRQGAVSNVKIEGRDYYIGAGGRALSYQGPPPPGPVGIKPSDDIDEKDIVVVPSTPSTGAVSGGSAIPETSNQSLADAMVSIALGEIGKKHGKETDEDNKVIYNNYGGDEWCAAFVVWVNHQAGGKFAKHVNAWELLASITGKPDGNYYRDNDTVDGVQLGNFTNIDQSEGVYHHNASGYKPRAGDVVYFGTPGNDAGYRTGHVGIVVAYDESADKVYTVEGNSGHMVRALEYDRTNTYITGYTETGGNSYGDIAYVTGNFSITKGTVGRAK